MGGRTNDDPVRLVHLRPPVTEDDLALVTGDRECIQLAGLPEPWVLDRLADVFAQRPETTLRVFGGYEELEYLARFPDVRHVVLEAQDDLASLEGLRHLPADIESLSLHTNEKSFSLAPVTRFGSLKKLSLTRVGGDPDALGELQTLDALLLRSVTLPDAAIVGRLPRLRRFELRLGGTPSLHGVETAPLEYVEIWQVRGLADMDPLAELRELRFLFLQSMRNVTALPDFGRCSNLWGAHLETMKGLTDLRGLAAAPALRALALIDMRHIRWEHLACFEGHRNLEMGIIGTGSLRRNDELRARLGLQDFTYALRAVAAGAGPEAVTPR